MKRRSLFIRSAILPPTLQMQFLLKPLIVIFIPSKLEKRSPSSIINQPVWVQSLRETSASHNSRTIHSVKKRRSSLKLEVLFIFFTMSCLTNLCPTTSLKKESCQNRKISLETKGSFHLRFSGFCPLRGYPPPYPLNGKSV